MGNGKKVRPLRADDWPDEWTIKAAVPAQDIVDPDGNVTDAAWIVLRDPNQINVADVPGLADAYEQYVQAVTQVGDGGTFRKVEDAITAILDCCVLDVHLPKRPDGSRPDNVDAALWKIVQQVWNGTPTVLTAALPDTPLSAVSS